MHFIKIIKNILIKDVKTELFRSGWADERAQWMWTAVNEIATEIKKKT